MKYKWDDARRNFDTPNSANPNNESRETWSVKEIAIFTHRACATGHLRNEGGGRLSATNPPARRGSEAPRPGRATQEREWPVLEPLVEPAQDTETVLKQLGLLGSKWKATRGHGAPPLRNAMTQGPPGLDPKW